MPTDKPLSKDEKKWKSMIDSVDDPSLLNFICSCAEDNPNYQMNDEEEEETNDSVDDSGENSGSGKKKSPFPPMNKDNQDSNYEE